MGSTYPLADTGTAVWWGAVLVLTFPWIWPFSTGPWPAAQQAILTLACAGLLLVALAGWRLALAQALAASWLVAAGLSSLIGLAQYFGLSPALQPWVDTTELGQAFGNLRQRNQFATLTNLGLAALVWSPLTVRLWTGAHRDEDPQREGGGLATGACLLAMLLAVANAASASRTGLVQLGLLAAMAMYWSRGRDAAANRTLLAAAVTYAVAALVLPLMIGMNPADHGIGGRLSAEGLACGSRRTIWANVVHLIAQEPWSGWGWGELDYAHFMAAYGGLKFCEILDNAHNLPLHLAVELGLPLAVAICAGGLYATWRGQPWRATMTAHRMAWAALALILLHSMLEYPLWYGPFQLASVVAVGLLLAGRTVATERVQGRVALPLPLRLPAAMAGVIAVAGATFAAWDYWRVSQLYVSPQARATAYASDTLEKVRVSWLFANQVRFAELVTTDLTVDNAAYVYALSGEVLHFSPEARVVEKRLESAFLLGQDAQAEKLIARFKEAFPKEYLKWVSQRLLARPEDSGAPTGLTNP